MRKIVIIGSTGQLACDLLRVFEGKAVGLNHQDVEVADEAAVLRKLQELQPHWVLNTAAFNRVDDCETNPKLAFEVNALGALHVARGAAAVGAGVVHFSTDYVFGADDRQPRRPYTEDDRPAPLGVYGASKCAGEHLVRIANPRHLIIRTCGLYGLSTSRKGWTFPELMLNKARAGESIRVVTDQVLTPTYTADLAAKVKEMIDRELTGLFHVTNAGACSWHEFTRELFAQAKVQASLEPILTNQSQRRARRPAYSVLAAANLQATGLQPLRIWREALQEYLRKKGFLSS
jgi:dTDP-4-dehydrorhamnose reductase